MSISDLFKQSELLNEIKATKEIEWVKEPNIWTSIVDIDETKIKLEIIKEIFCDGKEMITSVTFYTFVNDKWVIKQTPNNSATKILAYIFKAVHEYDYYEQPSSLVFLGDKQEVSRIKLYERLLKMLRKKGFPQTDIDDSGNFVVFFATRIAYLEQHKCKDKLFDALQKLNLTGTI
jgi:hypothetical protein